jgi:hypothetical protein
MRARHILTSTALAAVLIGVGTVGAGVTAAEAGPRHSRQADQKVQKPRKTVRHEAPRVVEQHRKAPVAEPRHRKVERRVERRRTVQHAPSIVYRSPRRVVRTHRPWYVQARHVEVHHSPFYFHTGLGLYIGGVYLDFEFGDFAPRGYIYEDPYCGLEFVSVPHYRDHLHRHHHAPALRVVRICDY